MELGRLVEVLRRMSTIPSRASKSVSEKINEALQAQFDSGVDSYGNAWAPLSPVTLARGRTPPPLTDTGALRSGTKAAPMPGAGIKITIDAPYGVYHQTGTAKMPARPILPASGVPAKWDALIRSSVDEEFRKDQ